jgi:hypothetical protein
VRTGVLSGRVGTANREICAKEPVLGERLDERPLAKIG